MCVHRWVATCSGPIKGGRQWKSLKSPVYGTGKPWCCVSRRRHFAGGGWVREDFLVIKYLASNREESVFLSEETVWEKTKIYNHLQFKK